MITVVSVAPTKAIDPQLEYHNSHNEVGSLQDKSIGESTQALTLTSCEDGFSAVSSKYKVAC